MGVTFALEMSLDTLLSIYLRVTILESTCFSSGGSVKAVLANMT